MSDPDFVVKLPSSVAEKGVRWRNEGLEVVTSKSPRGAVTKVVSRNLRKPKANTALVIDYLDKELGGAETYAHQVPEGPDSLQRQVDFAVEISTNVRTRAERLKNPTENLTEEAFLGVAGEYLRFYDTNRFKKR